MKRLSSEVSSDLSLALGIAMPVVYTAAMRVYWFTKPGFFVVVAGSFLGIILGLYAVEDKGTKGWLRITAILGIMINVIWLAVSLLLKGTSIRPDAQLF